MTNEAKKIQHVDVSAANAYRAMAWRATFWADQYAADAIFYGADPAELPPDVPKPYKRYGKAVRDLRGELVSTFAAMRAAANLLSLIQADMLLDGTQEGPPLGRDTDLALSIELLQQIEGWLRPHEANDIVARERVGGKAAEVRT